jgi:hypothetical protein
MIRVVQLIYGPKARRPRCSADTIGITMLFRKRAGNDIKCRCSARYRVESMLGADELLCRQHAGQLLLRLLSTEEPEVID